MKNQIKIPKFKSETEEAEWWHKNRAKLDQDMAEAAKNGRLNRLDTATLKARLANSKSRVISIRVPETDIALAQQQAAERGLPYQTYIKSLLHQALREKR